MKSTFEIKRQVAGTGMYCRIEIDFISDSSINGYELAADKNSKWYPALLMGTAYFFEHADKSKSDGVRITVENLHTMPVDSSLIIVMYAVVKVLEQASGFTVPGLSIKTIPAICFPK